MNVIAPVVAALLPTMSFAENWTSECKFERECMVGEACLETEFDVQIDADAANSKGYILTTPSETLSGTGIRLEGPGHMIFVGKTALHVISSEATGALYTIHLQDALAITYTGSCKVVQ